jgi:hypothetical protein
VDCATSNWLREDHLAWPNESRLGTVPATEKTVRLPLALPGESCESDHKHSAHAILDPVDDVDLRTVYGWLAARDLPRLLTGAVNDAVEYVLDGARTWRFDLTASDVDSDERRSVGTKLQYRVISAFKLIKEPPLDTTVLGIPLELKGTIGRTWMIPREGQCEICLLIKVDAGNDRHRAYLMRTHRLWLNKPNQDQKRSIRADALEKFAIPLIPWTALPANPLKSLTDVQRQAVFSLRDGQNTRLTAMFGALPEKVIPRTTILTVCANREDPMRRAREIKESVLEAHGLRVLCGKWPSERAEAALRGFDLSDNAWVAVWPQAPGAQVSTSEDSVDSGRPSALRRDPA